MSGKVELGDQDYDLVRTLRWFEIFPVDFNPLPKVPPPLTSNVIRYNDFWWCVFLQTEKGGQIHPYISD